MKNFNIPGVQAHFVLNTTLLNLKLDFPEYFYPDVNISSVYGCFQYCIWDGGRNFAFYHQQTEEDILYIKEQYQHHDIPIRLIFTNPVVEKKHLYDRFGNLLLEIFDNDNNEIVVNSPLLEDYIRTNFPKYKIVSSTTKRLTKPEDLLKELNRPEYYQVCLDYDLNKNMELLNAIPMELRSKCEFLTNAICPAHCPDRKKHYDENGWAHLSYLRDKYLNKNCAIQNACCHPDSRGKGNNLSLEDIDNYHKMGYKYFKIEGRTFTSPVMLLEYLYYLVKPEWRDIVLSRLFEIGDGIFVNSPNDRDVYQFLGSNSPKGVAK